MTISETVAPHTGAWIEIFSSVLKDSFSLVAPHTGAWIEIFALLVCIHLNMVAPHTGAWIEIINYEVGLQMLVVAPHTGAWIEIKGPINAELVYESHPTRVRGLKYGRGEGKADLCPSHPTRVRGLKSCGPGNRREGRVAPHTGAWIEIQQLFGPSVAHMSHPTRVRGLKLECIHIRRPIAASHPTRVRGLK